MEKRTSDIPGRFPRVFVILGSVNAGLAVILGAFGAHLLKGRLPEGMLATYNTGVEYHFFHALGLFAVAFVSSRLPDSTLVRWSGWFMVAGILLFSGSLYLLSLTGISLLGAVTPFGGMSLIAAWLLLALAAIKADRKESGKA